MMVGATPPIVAMAGNQVLKRHAEPLMVQAHEQSEHSGQSERFYGECRYGAKSWSRERRVIIGPARVS